MSNPALHGTWEMIRAELNGENSLELLALRVELELDHSTYLVRFAGEVADHGTYTHHEAGPPARLTIQGSIGPNAGRTIPCIYQLAGDRLRVCYGMDGSAPTAFASPAGSPHYLATYRRKATP
jgi:uncharacterized protein (TIGR03067 family)